MMLRKEEEGGGGAGMEMRRDVRDWRRGGSREWDVKCAGEGGRERRGERGGGGNG